MSKFIPTEKYLDLATLALKKEVSLLVCEGTVRSSKTEFSKLAFILSVLDSEEYLHLIAAKDLDAIQDNILNGDLGLLQMFPNHLSLKKDEIGGYYVNVRNIDKSKRDKKILLAGYSNKTKWEKILGKTLGICLIDEVNIADETFIDEVFARQFSVDKPLQIWTLNGSVPDHFIYQKYINRCNIVKKYRDKVPASIIADMDKRVDKMNGWYYMHFNMHDNPTMNEEKIKRAYNTFPVGSFYYKIKTLGERGASGKLIYIDYLSTKLIKKIINKPKHEIKENEVSFRDYQEYEIGCDIGSTKAQNSFTLTGFSLDNSKMVFVDKETFQNVGYEYKKQRLIQFVKTWLQRGINISAISIDSAEQNFIRDLQSEFARLNLPPVVASYKATIKERIDFMIIMASANRVNFNDNQECNDLYDAFMMCKWAEKKEGIEREDLNEPHIDKVDSAEYSFTRRMKAMLAYEGARKYA